MLTLNADKLEETILRAWTQSQKNTAFMLWSAPGTGKSSIAQAVAERLKMPSVKLEIGTMGPHELGGIPCIREGRSHYGRPHWMPKDATPIVLILDDITHAPSRALSQCMSLILEHRVLEHQLPPGSRVIATGNRVKDGAGAFQMPTAIGNRLIHVELLADVETWRAYGVKRGLSEDVLGFIGFRPELLHKPNKQEPAWCSPRSWEVANTLHELSLPIDGAVGTAAAGEFRAYVALKSTLPDLAPIVSGEGRTVPFPEELSLKWAVVSGLAFNVDTIDEVTAAFQYLEASAGPEWVSLFLQDVTHRFGAMGRLAELASLMAQNEQLSHFVDGLLEIVA